MKIAVTGGTGIIGQSLLELLPENYKAVVVSRTPGEYNLKNLKVDLRKTDYSVDSLVSIFEDCKAVVHLAAKRLEKANPDASFRNIILDYSIFKACDLLNITNVVFTSSRGVYGGNPNVPWTEDSQSEPDNPYSLAKLLSEQTADFFNKKGLSIKCLRIAQVLSADSRKKYAVGNFISKSLKGEPLEVYATEDQIREYIYVKDAVRGIFAALDKPEVKGIFNLGSEETVTIPELAAMINRLFESEGKIIRREPDTIIKEYSLMDSRLFYSTFEFQTKWTLEEALLDIYKTLKY